MHVKLKENIFARTEVPEQLVVLDPNMASVDENYVRILQRYKELLKNAGSMDESDIEMMRSPSKQVRILASDWSRLIT